jgi:hypothetical protein
VIRIPTPSPLGAYGRDRVVDAEGSIRSVAAETLTSRTWPGDQVQLSNGRLRCSGQNGFLLRMDGEANGGDTPTGTMIFVRLKVQCRRSRVVSVS